MKKELWNEEGSRDAGVEGGELEAVLFREGEKVGVGGVFVISAPGGKVSAGGEIVGEEAVAVVQLGEKVIQAIGGLLYRDGICGFLNRYANEAEFHNGSGRKEGY